MPEPRTNPITGALESWVRVFDHEDGILRLEGYEDSSINHNTVIDDGSLELSDTQAKDHFEAMSAEILGKARAKTWLVATPAQAAQAKPPPPAVAALPGAAAATPPVGAGATALACTAGGAGCIIDFVMSILCCVSAWSL